MKELLAVGAPIARQILGEGERFESNRREEQTILSFACVLGHEELESDRKN